jgi:hypothetical protein
MDWTDALRNLTQSLSVVTPLLTILLAFFGLSSWRKKLWGENKFTLATATIKELYLLKEEIKNYRSGFYPAGEIYTAIAEYKKDHPDHTIDERHSSTYAELKRWNQVVEQFLKFTTELTKLKVILNRYDVDKISGKTMEEHVRELSVKRQLRQFDENQEYYLQYMDEQQRAEYFNSRSEIGRVLVRSGTDDKFEQDLESYFSGFNKIVRKYISN